MVFQSHTGIINNTKNNKYKQIKKRFVPGVAISSREDKNTKIKKITSFYSIKGQINENKGKQGQNKPEASLYKPQTYSHIVTNVDCFDWRGLSAKSQQESQLKRKPEGYTVNLTNGEHE